jgi:hypothetical protein
MPEPTFDVAVAPRWLAIEANNGAWDLVEKADRTAADTDQMLHLAHAACWHWQPVGQPINQLRALTLLTTAYVAAKLAEPALRFGEQSKKRLAEVGPAATPFDQACVHGSLAAAYQLAKQPAAATRCYEAAAAIVAKFDDAEDRAVFDKLYPRPQ